MSHLLARGDTVAVLASGFAVQPAALDSGIAALARMGYRVLSGAHVRSQAGYLAGSDAERASDLLEMLERPDVRGLWFARGGWGTSRLLPALRWKKLASRPKLLVGYSDLTALFAPYAERCRQVCLYGPAVAELGDPATYHRPSLRALLAGQPLVLRLRPGQVLVPGRARGRLAGGNLTVLAHLLGTPFEPDLRGVVLFLEEIGEEAYRIDRLLTQLRLSGALSKLAAVVLGGFLAPARRNFPPDRQLTEIWSENFAGLGVPVVTGLPAGHVPAKRTLPLGGVAELDTFAGTLRLSPSPRG